MKKLSYLIAMALMAFTFTSCEDVPSPFGEVIPPVDPEEEETVVVDPTGSGTEADPYNVAAALELCATMTGDDAAKEAVVKGYISSIDDMSTSYGNCSYKICDDADGKTTSLIVYRGYGLDGAKFTTGDEIKQGDLVVVSGGLVNFKGNTPEFTTGSKILSINGEGGGGGGGGEEGETIGTKDDPISIDKALELINALDDGAESTQNAYVKGKVVKVTTNQENFDKYKNLNYLISVDGTDNGKTITVYSGDGLNGEKFSGITDLAQGDEVIVFGKLYKYVNAKTSAVTPEIAKGNYLVSLVKGSGGGGGGGTGEAAGSGTKDDPYNVVAIAEIAAKLGDKEVSEADYYFKGKICSVKYEFSASYGTATFNVSDDGNTGGPEFTCYSVYYLGNQPWADGNTQIKVNDEVIIYGKVTNYGGTLETSSKKAYIYSLNGKTDESGGGGGGSGATSLDVNFKADGQGAWTISNVTALPDGVSYIWSYDSKYGMKASGYISGTRYETDSWLVSPELNLASGATMTFKQALNYATSEYVHVMYTTTSKSGDVNPSDWKEASVDEWPAGTSWTFMTSNATLPAGTVRVALRYTSTTSTAATWEIETISIR